MDFKEFKEKLFEEAYNKGLKEFEIYYSDKESLSINIYKDYEYVNNYHKELENIDPQELINLALNMEKECKVISDKVTNFIGCGISYVNLKYGIINSKGLDLSDKSNLLTAYVVPVLDIEGKKYDGFGYGVAKNVTDIVPHKIAKHAIDEAMEKVGSKIAPSNKYKTIIRNEAMVSLLQAFWSVFDGDSAQNGISLLKDKEGEMIASSKVTIIDNPLLEDGLASVAFDDEGVKTFKKELVKCGELKTLLHNLKTANKANIKSTGSGFKAVGPTNFYIEKGNKDLNDLIEEVKEGVIITEFSGLHSGANSITGDFSLAAKGFMIEDGKKSYPIEQITVAGNFFTLLKDIEDVCTDIKFPMSSFGSPSVLVKELSVAGK